MDRTLQSGLEKRTRVGAWSSRVYRLERGYLSAWTDVSRVTAKEEPSRTECLFEGNQVAKLTDQGDRRFKLDFPWDSSRGLQLRASNLAMKKAWMDVLKATLKEISAQIQGTGAVFAYGGVREQFGVCEIGNIYASTVVGGTIPTEVQSGTESHNRKQ